MLLSNVLFRGIFSATLLACVPVFAASLLDQTRNDFPTPPDDAIVVCLNKTVDSPCEFGSGNKADSGLCQYTGDQKYFACNPHAGEDRPPRPGDEGERPVVQEEGSDRPPRPEDSSRSEDGVNMPSSNQESELEESEEKGVKRYPSHLAPSTSS